MTHAGPVMHGATMAGLGVSASDGDFNNFKKAKYKNDLLNQMGENQYRKYTNNEQRYWDDVNDDERVRFDQAQMGEGARWDDFQRKKYLMKDGFMGGGGYDDYYRGGYSRYGARSRGGYPGHGRYGNITKSTGNVKDTYGWWYGGGQEQGGPRSRGRNLDDRWWHRDGRHGPWPARDFNDKGGPPPKP